MKGSFRIARLFGIDVAVHWTFFLLGIYVLYLSTQRGVGLAGTLVGGVFVLSLFACVLMHEYGHALTARAYGVGTKHITLLPIGGVAALQRMPSAPHQELLIALAGPAVNVVIAIGLGLAVAAFGDIPTARNAFTGSAGLLTGLLVVNVGLVIFNLLPAFPMDGGRVLRALLAMGMTRVKATKIAARVGQVMAVLFLGVGLYLGDLMLLLIAGFVFWVGRMETKNAVRRGTLESATVGELMTQEFAVVSPDDLVRDVAQMARPTQLDFPVLDAGASYLGMLTRDAIGRVMTQGPAHALVGQAMRTDVELLDADMTVADAVDAMHALGLASAPVGHGRVTLGVLTFERVSEVLVQAERRPSQSRR